MDEQRDIGKVLELYENDVLVEVQRKGSCKNCSVNMLCMGNSERVKFRVGKPSFPLMVGDEVCLEISPGDRLFSSFILFIFPILTMVVFYFLIKNLLGLSEDFAIFGSLFGLLLSAVVIKWIDSVASKKVMVKIIELVKKAGEHNNLSAD